MRFTKSIDGKLRTSVRVVVRLTKEELEIAQDNHIKFNELIATLSDRSELDFKNWLSLQARIAATEVQDEFDPSDEELEAQGGS